MQLPTRDIRVLTVHVDSTEYTEWQLRTFHHDGKISSAWWEWGARPPLFAISTITYGFAVFVNPILGGGRLLETHFRLCCMHAKYCAALPLSLLTRRLQRDVVYFGWPIAPSYMSPNAEGGGSCGANKHSCVHSSPNKLWRSSITPYLL